MSVLKLQPGLLVQLKTKVEGGVKYRRQDLEAHEEGATVVTEWKTTRRIDDAAEFKEAGLIRSRARSMVEKACIKTPFGLICSADEEARFDSKVDEAQGIIAEFNGRAHHSRIKLTFLCGQIAQDKASAVASIREEISQLLEDLERVSREGDTASIRTVATRATEMSRLLEQKSEARGVLAKAIRTARGIATQIVKRVEKQGEELASVLEGIQLSPIAQARFAFLGEESEDVAEVEEEQGVEEPDGEDREPVRVMTRSFSGIYPSTGEEEEGDPFGFEDSQETTPDYGLPQPAVEPPMFTQAQLEAIAAGGPVGAPVADVAPEDEGTEI